MGPRVAELKGVFDPIKLAESSVDLNLKVTVALISQSN